jgi:hypothetical protein
MPKAWSCCLLFIFSIDFLLLDLDFLYTPFIHCPALQLFLPAPPPLLLAILAWLDIGCKAEGFGFIRTNHAPSIRKLQVN